MPVKQTIPFKSGIFFTKLKKFYVKRIYPLVSKNKYGGITFGVIASLFFFCHHLTRPTLRSTNDLLQISGKLSTYSFVNGSRGYHYYCVYLDTYNNCFQIPADFLGYFDESKFKNQAGNKALIQIKIPAQYKNDLNNGKALLIYLLTINGLNVLSENDTIEEAHSRFDIYAGSGFFLFGLCFYLYRKYQK